MNSRLGACEKIEIADFGETPQRHSREGGNPFQPLEQALRWVPAFAGTTLRPGFKRFSQFVDFFTRSFAGMMLVGRAATFHPAAERAKLPAHSTMPQTGILAEIAS